MTNNVSGSNDRKTQAATIGRHRQQRSGKKTQRFSNIAATMQEAVTQAVVVQIIVIQAAGI